MQLSASRIDDKQVELKIKANDERNIPTWAYLTVVGVHRSVLELAPILCAGCAQPFEPDDDPR